MIKFVADRPFNDPTYATDFSKISKLGWHPTNKLHQDFNWLAEKILKDLLNSQNEKNNFPTTYLTTQNDASHTTFVRLFSNLNDAESLVPFLQEIADVFINQKDYVYELIVVDDGSTDNSVEKILEYSKSSPNIKLIELSRNFGQQIALYVGLTQSKGQIMVTVDGDGHPPECIIKLADAIRDGYEMASGNRKNRQDDIFGRITSKIGAYLIKRVLDQTITDFGSIKAFQGNWLNVSLPAKSEIQMFIQQRYTGCLN